MSDLVIQMKVDDALNLKGNPRMTKTFYAKGLHWKLFVESISAEWCDSGEVVSAFVCCNWESECSDWSCDWVAECTVVNRVEANHRTNTMQCLSEASSGNKGICFIFKWNELMDERKGFLVDGSFAIEVRIRVNKTIGIRVTNRLDFSHPIDNITNVVLLVENRRLHVSKQILSMWSPVFHSMFFGGFSEAGKEEVEIKEVEYDQFVDFLNFLHPSAPEILASNVPHLLALADRFQVESIMARIETYLLATEKVDNAAKLAYADQYRLNVLLDRSLNKYKSTAELFQLKKTTQYKTFANDTKAAICDRLMELSNDQ